ncbi:MAG: DUF2380 domain-containing protein [Gemmatimonadales bacterium]
MSARRVSLFFLLLVAGGHLAAQSGRSRPALAVLNLRFDGEHANVLEPGDTAVAMAATSRLLATLEASERVAVLDSARVAGAVAAATQGNPCDNSCALAIGRQLGAQWVAKGTVTKTSNLVWVLSAQLIEVTTGKLVLSDGYELKGDATRMAPAGAHVFAQRVEKAIVVARTASTAP